MDLKPDKYSTIGLFDTSIATLNVGDEIIMDGVRNALTKTFPESRFVSMPSHEKIFRTSISIIRHSALALVGGSNILSSNMHSYKQWKIDWIDSLLIKEKVVLMGVGWRAYQGKTHWYTRFMLKQLLNKQLLHSVRDAYTENKLREIGVLNVINTGCPTMWMLTESHCNHVPTSKSNQVIFTLTDYNKDHERDRFLIEVLLKEYNQVHFWVQGKRDYEYFTEFGELTNKIRVVPPNLCAYDNFLRETTCDYVGTRLHGGIRALQYKKRTIIIGIDNRATEKKEDFNLPVIAREQIQNIGSMINGNWPTMIKLPFESIERWKGQFQK
jgi:polysaccharide pyruvyl transferase WcaK-like protein